MGVAYLLMDHGVDIFTAFGDALVVGKFQLALTLLSKTTRAKRAVLRPGTRESLLHVLASARPQSERQLFFDRFAVVIAEALVQRFGLDQTLVSAAGDSWLHCAARSGNYALVRHIIDTHKPVVDAMNKHGETPLACAVAAAEGVTLADQARTVKVLVDSGSKSSASRGLLLQLVARACKHGVPMENGSPTLSELRPGMEVWLRSDAISLPECPGTVEQYREKQAVIRQVGSQTVSCSVVRTIDRWGPNFNTINILPSQLILTSPEGMQFLATSISPPASIMQHLQACGGGAIETMAGAYILFQLLQLRGIDVNQQVEGISALCHLVQRQHVGYIVFFLDACKRMKHSVSVNDKVAGGTSLVHIAVRGETGEAKQLYTTENVDLLLAIVEAGAKPDVRDNAGKPPLFYAYQQVSGAMRKALLAAGAKDLAKKPAPLERFIQELPPPVPVEDDLQAALTKYGLLDDQVRQTQASKDKQDEKRTEVDPLTKLQGLASVAVDENGAMWVIFKLSCRLAVACRRKFDADLVSDISNLFRRSMSPTPPSKVFHLLFL